jgi:flagellar biosynthetic protein FliR
MDLDSILQLLPVYVLVLFRVAGMMVFAPMLGSDQIPRRAKGLMACVLALSMARGIKPPVVPVDSLGLLAVGIGGEIIFGLAMGMILSFCFIAAQWAGEIVGQQMGLNLSETFDPQFGQQGSIVGNLYFMLTLVVFVSINGHHAMLRGVRASFDTLPLLSVGMSRPILDLFIDLFSASTQLALQLAAPVLVTLLITDLALGFVGKTMPQLNIMSAGLSIRALVGMLVIIFGIGITSSVIRDAVWDDTQIVVHAYSSTLVNGGPAVR